MLPDFPTIKRHVATKIAEAVKTQKQQALGPFSECKEKPIHEGNRDIIKRADGTLDETEFHQIRVEHSVSIDEVENLSDEQILERYMEMAHEMADKQSEVALSTINEAVTRTGNVIQTSGITPQTLLDTLAKMPIAFKPDGKHEDLATISGPEMQVAMKEAFRLMETDPHWSKKYSDLIKTKRDEWNARENSRKLVG